MTLERRWSHGQVVWGETLCAGRCGAPAELLYEGEPFCAIDAERLLTRQQLLAEFPGLELNLPPVFRADEA